MRIFVAAALALTLPVLAQAQAVTNISNHKPESVSRAYRVFQDEPVANWRELNDTVGRIGGWKVYAREQLPADSSATLQDANVLTSGAQK